MSINRVYSRLAMGFGAASLSGAAFAAGGTAAAGNSVGLVVPSYFNATQSVANWASLAASARKVPTTAILNPNSGPGTSADANYAAAVSRLHAAGGKVIGYVSTSYAKRPLSAVVADINSYVAFYKVDGFFIDEMTSDSRTAHIQFYQSIYNYIKGLGQTYSVTGNPGTNIPELYATLPTADAFVVFEGNAKDYRSYRPMSWQANYPRSRFTHIIYNASAAQLQTVVSYAKTHGAGSVYVTSRTGSNPYNALPAYWNDEVADALAP
ncbi:spherulation-specific family 4 protein [Caballeronia sp. LZ062]|uniref:spherulation-specific family 4 protein n=1 Tax=unclassified Caballeronia TaxID=2646786 RepID=UPI002864AC3E|nr:MULTISPECIES: spherulation-specific family 4 protein [unclassified Caballeronia]MDR5856576.1 spherulation-specific family 4 protein [Caballeronia sp. LZ050]MDR5873246.1 spherulation-specific family 4 protein [Caballeronia sp. LZ062]